MINKNKNIKNINIFKINEILNRTFYLQIFYKKILAIV